jgi:hypothetical protein
MIRTGSFTHASTWSQLLILPLLCAISVFGATITVTNTNDSGPGSLRQAVADSASGDTITFSVRGTITVLTTLQIGSPQPKTLTISGPGATVLSISGGDLVPTLVVQPLSDSAAITLTISGLTIEHGSSVLGAGIANIGNLTLNRCRVTTNNTTIPGGNILGGGIANLGTLTLNDTVVGFNAATLAGGIYNIGTLTLNSSTVVSNTAFGDSLSVGAGGGIYNAGNGRLTLNNSTLENNDVYTSANGGLNEGVGYGGGIFNEQQGTVTLTNSTVSNNEGGGDLDCCAFYGAGILNVGTLSLLNSTVAGNHTPGDGTPGGNGGGIANFGALDISNSTIADNRTNLPGFCGDFCVQSGAGAGIYNGSSANITIKNSILANNHGGNCLQNASPTGTRTSLGHNLSDDAFCTGFLTDSSDSNSTPAGLDTGLKNNGGPTQTVALLSGSPAVNAIPLTNCTDASGRVVATDQRGVTRPQGTACDIGAYELFQSKLLVQAVATYQIIDSVLVLPIPSDTQQGLIAPLQSAITSINSGKSTPAIGQLGAFINQANGDVKDGVLTQQQATPLTTAAQAVIQSLTGN